MGLIAFIPTTRFPKTGEIQHPVRDCDDNGMGKRAAVTAFFNIGQRRDYPAFGFFFDDSAFISSPTLESRRHSRGRLMLVKGKIILPLVFPSRARQPTSFEHHAEKPSSGLQSDILTTRW